MAEEKKQLDKILQAVSQSQKAKITDFDTGILQSFFETKQGTPEQQFNEHRKDLTAVTARLLRIKLQEKEHYDKRFDDLLMEIKKFFKLPLPNVTSAVDDTAQKDRIMRLRRTDGADSTCTSETIQSTTNRIDLEQFHMLINQACWLKAVAASFFDENVLQWHDNKDFKLNIPGVGTVLIEG